MMDLTALKAKVKALAEGITGIPVYYDMVPLGVNTGCLIAKGATEFTGRTVDGDAHTAGHAFDVFIFTFESAEVCDGLTTSLVNATDGKCNDDFRLIEVISITPAEYNPDEGFHANMIGMKFIEK